MVRRELQRTFAGFGPQQSTDTVDRLPNLSEARADWHPPEESLGYRSRGNNLIMGGLNKRRPTVFGETLPLGTLGYACSRCRRLS